MDSMRFCIAAWVAVLGTAACAQPVSKDTQRQLMLLEPETRTEQRCNGRASGLSVREHKLKAPDEVVAYAFGDDVIHGSHVDAPGAAIRDGGQWFHLSYHCEATSDGLGIVSFEYKLGAVVPRKDWAAHSLVP
jgi:hypothetical protein